MENAIDEAAGRIGRAGIDGCDGLAFAPNGLNGVVGSALRGMPLPTPRC